MRHEAFDWAAGLVQLYRLELPRREHDCWADEGWQGNRVKALSYDQAGEEVVIPAGSVSV